jgi:hypothetical protein
MISTRRQPRRGTLVVCVLVCLLVASTIATAMTQSALRARRELRLGHQMRQTELLLDAGILRAARKIQASRDYEGETWRPTTAIARFEGALVEINVNADDQQAGRRRVEVVASLGTSSDGSERKRLPLTRRTHVFRIESSHSSLTSESPTAE